MSENQHQLYTVVTTDLLTGEILSTIEMNDMYWEKVYQGPGSFYGTVRFDAPSSIAANLNNYANGIWVVKDGVIKWGGKMGRIQRRGETRSISVPAIGFFDYLNQRILRNAQGMSHGSIQRVTDIEWNNVDPFYIFKDCVDHAQSFEDGDIGLNVVWDALSGYVVREVQTTFSAKRIGPFLLQIANRADTGFDILPVFRWENGQPRCDFKLIAPQLNTFSDQMLLFQLDRPTRSTASNINSVSLPGSSAGKLMSTTQYADSTLANIATHYADPVTAKTVYRLTRDGADNHLANYIGDSSGYDPWSRSSTKFLYTKYNGAGSADPNGSFNATASYFEDFANLGVGTGSATLAGTEWELYNSVGNAGFGIRSPNQIAVVSDVTATSNGKCMRITAQNVGGVHYSGGAKLKLNHTAYGQYELRARCSDDASQVTSGVLLTWPQSNLWPQDGEIDFWETYDHRDTRTPVQTNLHVLSPSAVLPYDAGDDYLATTHLWTGIDQSDWNKIVVSWTPTEIWMNVNDGAKVSITTDASIIPHTGMDLCIQLDAWSSTPPSSPVTLDVDYIVIRDWIPPNQANGIYVYDMIQGASYPITTTDSPYSYPIFSHDEDEIYFLKGLNGTVVSGSKPIRLYSAPVPSVPDYGGYPTDTSSLVFDILAAAQAKSITLLDVRVLNKNCGLPSQNRYLAFQCQVTSGWQPIIYDVKFPGMKSGWSFDTAQGATYHTSSDINGKWADDNPDRFYTIRCTSGVSHTPIRAVWNVAAITQAYAPATTGGTQQVSGADMLHHPILNVDLVVAPNSNPWSWNGSTGTIYSGKGTLFSALHLNLDRTSITTDLEDIRAIAEEYDTTSGALPYLYLFPVGDFNVGTSDSDISAWSDIRSNRKLAGHRQTMSLSAGSLPRFKPFPKFSPNGKYVIWQSDSNTSLDSQTYPGPAGGNDGTALVYTDLYLIEAKQSVSTIRNVKAFFEGTDTDWTPSAAQTLASDWGTAGNRHWKFILLTNGKLRFEWSTDGTNSNTVDSTSAVSFGNGTVGTVSVKFDVNNGSGNSAALFRQSTNHGLTWTTL